MRDRINQGNASADRSALFTFLPWTSSTLLEPRAFLIYKFLNL